MNYHAFLMTEVQRLRGLAPDLVKPERLWPWLAQVGDLLAHLSIDSQAELTELLASALIVKNPDLTAERAVGVISQAIGIAEAQRSL